MPANNRMHTSSSLQTTGIWANTIGYDPYASEKEKEKTSDAVASAGQKQENFKNFLQLARLSGNLQTDDNRGACKRCGKVGHLSFQCRNFLGSLKEEDATDNSGKAAGPSEQLLDELPPANDPSDSSDLSSDSEEEEERRERKRKHHSSSGAKEKKKHKKHKKEKRSRKKHKKEKKRRRSD